MVSSGAGPGPFAHILNPIDNDPLEAFASSRSHRVAWRWMLSKRGASVAATLNRWEILFTYTFYCFTINKSEVKVKK